MERAVEMFRWTDRDKDFFALFVRAYEIIVEDRLLIKVFEEFFQIVYLEVSLLVWTIFFSYSLDYIYRSSQLGLD